MCMCTYRSVYGSDCGDGIYQRKRHSFLFSRLPTSTRYPSQDHAVAGIDSGCERAHCEVTSPGIKRTAGQDKPEDRNSFGDRDMPHSFVETP